MERNAKEKMNVTRNWSMHSLLSYLMRFYGSYNMLARLKMSSNLCQDDCVPYDFRFYGNECQES